MSTQTLPLIKNYIDRDQLEQLAASSDLWVTLSPERISLLVASKNTNLVIGLTVLELAGGGFFQKGLFELRAWFEGLELYKLEYQNVNLVFETPEYTIVPEALFLPEKADVLLSAVVALPKFYSVRNTRMENRGCVDVFAFPDIFYSTLKVLFPQASVHHYAEYLVSAIAVINEKKQDTVFVNLHNTYLDALHFNNQQLKFVNTFSFEADTDIIFFILSIAEQQKITIDKLQLVLMGDFNVNSTLLQLLRKYVPYVSVYKRNEDFVYPASFREFQDQHYFIQTAALLCE
jgi:hypothetical protein